MKWRLWKIIRWFQQLMCNHGVVQMAHGAHHACNWDNQIRIECVACGHIEYRYGRDICPPYKEDIAIYKKGRKK